MSLHTICMYIYNYIIYIYTRGAWGSPMEKRWGGVGWGGVGHVTVMFMLR